MSGPVVSGALGPPPVPVGLGVSGELLVAVGEVALEAVGGGFAGSEMGAVGIGATGLCEVLAAGVVDTVGIGFVVGAGGVVVGTVF